VSEHAPVLVLAVGNPSCGDDAIGQALAERLEAAALPGVEVISGFQSLRSPKRALRSSSSPSPAREVGGQADPKPVYQHRAGALTDLPDIPRNDHTGADDEVCAHPRPVERPLPHAGGGADRRAPQNTRNTRCIW
jgi:hypothetical protein